MLHILFAFFMEKRKTIYMGIKGKKEEKEVEKIP